MAILELDEIKEWLGSGVNDSTENDDTLSDLEDRLSVMIESITGKRWRDPTDVQEVHSSDGRSHKIWLRNLPGDGKVKSVETRLDVGDTWTVLDAAEYEVRGRRVLRTQGNIWVAGTENIRIKYEAGFAPADVPSDIKQALLELVESAWHNRMTATPVLITEQTIDIPRNVGTILQRHKVVSGSGSTYEVL